MRAGGVSMVRVFLVILTLFLVTPVWSDLTVEDLDKIIQQSEKRIKDHVTQEREKLDIKIQAVDKLVDRNFYFLVGLIALIAVAVGVPQILLTLTRQKI